MKLRTIYTDEVKEALEKGKAIVALESTIVSHGMPYPENLATAQSLEAIVRQEGAVPATIALMDGAVHVGLDGAQLERLARAGRAAAKVSVRDVGVVLASGGIGATTVASTAFLAHRAGISVFATGGIGGVHRRGEVTMDVSADLTTLSHVPVCVVCAGAKSLLDIPRTLEVLETLGVPTVSLGQAEFPAFFVRDSGSKAAWRLDTEKAVAEAFVLGTQAGHAAGMVVGVPIPREAEAEGREIEACIQTALREADEQAVAGRDLTPFLLKRVNDLSGGRSLRANIALVRNNAAVAARIAKHMEAQNSGAENCARAPAQISNPISVCVIGGAFVDVLATSSSQSGKGGGGKGGASSVEEKPLGRVRMSAGGVGRNMAEVLVRLGEQVALVSAVCDDALGRMVLDSCRQLGIDASPTLRVPSGGGKSTGAFVSVQPPRGPQIAVSGTSLVEEELSAAWLAQASRSWASVPAVVVDMNVSAQVLETVVQTRRAAHGILWVEATSVDRCRRLMATSLLIAQPPLFRSHASGSLLDRPCLALSMNAAELVALASAAKLPRRATADHSPAALMALAEALMERTGTTLAVVTLGPRGAFAILRAGGEPVRALRKSSAGPALPVVSTVGAGDCLSAAFLAGVLALRGQVAALRASLPAVLDRAVLAAVWSTRFAEPVPPNLSLALLDAAIPPPPLHASL